MGGRPSSATKRHRSRSHAKTRGRALRRASGAIALSVLMATLAFGAMGVPSAKNLSGNWL